MPPAKASTKQREAFIAKAKELGVDESEAHFDASLRKMTPPVRPKATKKSPRKKP